MATDERARPAPAGFTDLRTLPGLRFDGGYHRADNFTGRRLPGYGAPGAWLVDAAAEALAAVQADLRPRGLGLLVYDAYRPRRATVAMVDWCERTGRAHLLDGYVGRRSRHNRGTAVDVGLVHLASGGVLPMGTAWDAFHAGSWFGHAVGAARANRRALREAMTARGFRPYDREWWHFELPLEPAPPERDVPYGADEPGEPDEPDADAAPRG
jgi:D-alanyl-D-alanine dipeptidase